MSPPRLIVITDRRLAAPRSVRDVVISALEAGAPMIQLRDKAATARALYEQALELVPLVHGHGAALVINDRLDVALAAGADGVHLGPDDLPVTAARRIVPPSFIVGYSTDDIDRARDAARAGASYIGCGAVFGTTSKAVGDERIGTARLDEVAGAVGVPVIGIGGVNVDNVAEVAATRAAGVAVVGAVMAATDPAAAVARLLAAFARDDAAR
ncbi:MAG TPA: thiamine phosphate synthase [Longimicrobiales bacterium]|nr:thiamine phosphate synthase [Longimicrobiales bacterium]